MISGSQARRRGLVMVVTFSMELGGQVLWQRIQCLGAEQVHEVVVLEQLFDRRHAKQQPRFAYLGLAEPAFLAGPSPVGTP